MKMIAAGAVLLALLSNNIADAGRTAQLPPDEVQRCARNYPQYWAATGVKVFRGGWFDIQYPAKFKVRRGMPSGWPGRCDSAFFTSPDSMVEFAVFVPQMGGNYGDIDVLPNPKVEKVVSKRTSISRNKLPEYGGGSVTWLTTAAKNGSYGRHIVYYHGSNDEAKLVSRAISIKFKNLKAYRKYRVAYEHFCKSLIRYGD